MRGGAPLLSLTLLALGFAGTTAHAQTPRPPAPPEAHQFDFWLGEWEVVAPNGQLAGASRIESVSDGHALLENWTGAKGGVGKSLNAWNAEKHQWQQFWVGNDGDVLELAGGLVDGSMVLRGEHAVNGRRTVERITWTPKPDGSVRQLWEQSTDDGKTWSVAFDGRYEKKKPPQAGGGGGDGELGPARRRYLLFM